MTTASSGTVTFLFTDIEGSTTRWEHHPATMGAALVRHDALLQEGITAQGGVVVTERGEGDSFFAFFARPSDALAAACAVQRALAVEAWPQEVAPIRVRMALHTGEAGMWEGRDYRGAAVNRCARLRAAGHGGQVLLSGATYELVRDALPDEVRLRDLGEHRLKDLTRSEHIFQILAPGLSTDFPPLKTLDRQRHNLPVQPTALIGREREVAAVCARLREAPSRLLTLTGPGGSGKTRLAVQVGAELLEGFPDGVFFVNLAPISDPALVVPTIGQTLGVIEAGSQPFRETLHAFLQEKHLLLILDNFEQVLDAAPVVSDLLAACPNVQVVVTSRAALRLYGERQYAVPPLTVPKMPPPPSLETLPQYEAVRLFIARAQDVTPDFSVTNESAPAVAEICVQLDGLPLAIELAAARVRLFPPQALLARLSHRLGVLTSGARDLPVRQRTLRATIDWSYRLLSVEEQVLFARLSVFVGGRTFEAIEAVCNTDGTLDVLAGADSLLEKNLLVPAEAEGEPRLAMLETIHEYARERLEASGETTALRQAHAAYFVALAEEIESGLKGPEQHVWLDRLEREHDNMRTALGWLRETGDSAPGLRLAGALGRFWEFQGHWSEGRRWLDGLLALPAPRDVLAATTAQYSQVRVAALNAAAILAVEQCDTERARVLAEESAAVAQATGNVVGLIDAFFVQSREAFDSFALDAARDFATKSLTLGRAYADAWRTARALHMLAYVIYHDSDYGQAAALWEESAALYRAYGDTRGQVTVLVGLGELLNDMGDIAQAVHHLEDAVRLQPKDRDAWARVQATLVLAEARMNQSAYRAADALFEQALVILGTLGSPARAARCHTQRAVLALAQGDDERAATLLDEGVRQAQAADALFEMARALMVRGDLLAYRDQYDHAEAAYQESLQLWEPMQIPMATAWVLRPSGVLAQRRGHLALARERLERARSLLATGEWRPFYAPILTALGSVATDEGDLDGAERLLREGLGLERAMGRPREIAGALEGLATVALTQCQPERAMRLGAAAAGIRTSIGAPLSPYDQVAFARTVDAAGDALGVTTFDAIWTSVQARPWEAIVEEVCTGFAG